MLSKIVIAGALSAVVAAVAPAHAEEGKQRFTHEGYTYVYEVKETKTGQRISGRRFPDAVAFNL
ncbi:MAG TPA: hypothetical protein VJM09_10270, partial [Sphingobium sp.]|nr:hypothetical protein [Sphingobium sp.]